MNPLASLRAYPFLLLWLAISARAPAAVSATPIAELRSLPQTELAAARPVLARGVVTYCNPNGDFVLQDASGGIWINVFLARQRHLLLTGAEARAGLKEGSEVEVEAITHLGGYSPSLLPSVVRVLGTRPLPAPRPLDRVSFFSGAEAGQRVEVVGTLLGVEPMSAGWRLRLQSGPDIIYVMALKRVLDDPHGLLDAELRVRGVAASGFNNRGEQLYPRIIVGGPGEVTVERRNFLPPFALPLVPLDQLDTFHSRAEAPHRKRIEGPVIFDSPGQFLYIQDGDRAVRVESPSTLPVKAGDRVQAVGYVDLSRHIAMLKGAEIRLVGSGPIPAPVAIAPDAVLKINTAAAITGQPRMDFDGHLIRFRAHLLAVQGPIGEGQPRWKLIVSQNKLVLGALLYPENSGNLDVLQPGSELELTGLVQLEYAPVEHTDPLLSPNRVDVILRSPADIVVVSAPSWWTAGRLLALVGAIGLILAGTLFWIWQLRRQVQRKTQEIAAEMRARRDAAIEFKAALRERNRLAANLHDTLLQTISGIGFQLEACEAEAAVLAPAADSQDHFTVARRMLDHAVGELRGSVWALRSVPQHGMTLAEALSNLAARATNGQAARAVVRAETDLPAVSDFIAGNLLLAAQEAIHNSIKHGHPTSIAIEVRAVDKGDGIELKIRDDGVGFVPGSQAGAAQGHFGLAGMGERIEGLAGTLRVESRPGRGTTVVITVPLRTYDEDLS